MGASGKVRKPKTDRQGEASSPAPLLAPALLQAGGMGQGLRPVYFSEKAWSLPPLSDHPSLQTHLPPPNLSPGGPLRVSVSDTGWEQRGWDWGVGREGQGLSWGRCARK